MNSAVVLAPGIRAIVRDWLDANHILVTGAGECVLIDTGCSAHAGHTLTLLREALGSQPLTCIVNTHCHSDHMGGNAALARAFDAPIGVPLATAPLIDRWDTRELLLDYADQHAERFAYAFTIDAGEALSLGGIEWRALAAPGHDMGALVFYAPEYRVLLSGDALWENGFGLIEPLDRLEERLQAQRATLECIAARDIAWVVPGHGAPFTNVRAALHRAFQRLDAYARDPRKLARHCLKAFFMFSLLARGRMAANDIAGYFDRVPCYREYNAAFFKLTAAALGEMITGELLCSRVIAIHDGEVIPT